MSERGEFTLKEIMRQPQAWEDALGQLESGRSAITDFIQSGGYDQVIFTGCGSPFFLARALKPYFQSVTGFPAEAIPASEIFLYAKASLAGKGKPLLVALSRSGETSEVLKAVEKFKTLYGDHVLAISPYADRPLNRISNASLVAPLGQEVSIAQTVAFTCMQLLGQGFAHLFAGQNLDGFNGLAAAGSNLLERYGQAALEIGTDLALDRIYFLGSGPRYGLACETNLKMKEMSLTHAEAFHFMEFRHGPKAMVSQQALVVGMISSSARAEETKVLQDMKLLGGNILVLGNHFETGIGDIDFDFQTSLGEDYYLPLYLPLLQLLAYSRSLEKGLDPDNPTNLDAVVFI